MSHLFQILGRHSWDISALVQNNHRFLVCLSVCSLTHFLTDIMLTVDISSSGWASFLKFSGDIPGMFANQFQIFPFFLYFVSLFIASLPYWNYINIGYIQFKMSYLSQIFLGPSSDVSTIAQNNFRIFVCQSVHCLNLA